MTYDKYVEFIKVRTNPVVIISLMLFAAHVQELPMSQLPEVFGMHDNVEETRILFDSVLVTQSQTSGGSSGKTTEEALSEITSDILSKVRCYWYYKRCDIEVCIYTAATKVQP